MTRFTQVTHNLALDVARHMRADDRREICSSMFAPDNFPATVAGTVMLCPDMMYCGWHNDRPVWIGGAMPRRPGVWELVSYATDDFRHIRFGVTRLATKVIIPAVLSGGAHRVFATTAAWRKGGSRWLEVLGMKYEGVRRADLADGSDLLVYALTRNAT